MKKQNGKQCVDPDETASYEASHLDLHCLHKYLFVVKEYIRLGQN